AKDARHAFIFGGVARDLFLRDAGLINRVSDFRDIDVVVDDSSFYRLQESWSEYVARVNRFGGLQLNVNSFVFDVWPLSGTWAFRKGYLGQPSFEALPRTGFLNIDG